MTQPPICAETHRHTLRFSPFNSIPVYTQTIKVNESISLKLHKEPHKMSITILQTVHL